jgi:hypothetical protein
LPCVSNVSRYLVFPTLSLSSRGGEDKRSRKGRESGREFGRRCRKNRYFRMPMPIRIAPKRSSSVPVLDPRPAQRRAILPDSLVGRRPATQPHSPGATRRKFRGSRIARAGVSKKFLSSLLICCLRIIPTPQSHRWKRCQDLSLEAAALRLPRLLSNISRTN